MTQNDHVENILIMGGGPAGYTAALYTARGGLNPVLLQGDQPGGQLTLTWEVENFPGFPEGIQGLELVEKMKMQAERFGARCLQETVEEVDFEIWPFSIRTQKRTYRTKTFVVASGASARFLGIASERRFLGRGVSACATCDGFFFRGKDVLVVGGGDSACEEALFLTKFARVVRIVHRRDQLRASKILQTRVLEHPKIQVVWNAVVEEILGDESKGVAGVRLKDTVTGEIREEPCDGIFAAIGHQPNTSVLKGKLDLDAGGYVVTKDGTRTSVPGVFAAGDVRDPRYRQAVTAAASGCMAALDASRFLEAREAS